MYKIVKRYYDRVYYSNGDVAKFVLAEKITDGEYEQITGKNTKASGICECHFIGINM